MSKAKAWASNDPLVKTIFEEIAKQGRTICDVSQRAGLDPSTVSKWQSGRTPTIANARAVLNVLGIDIVTRSMTNGNEV